jgi:hypothetical protein
VSQEPGESAAEPGRTFLLGPGCMKGGTTWLHDYLASSAQCDPGYRKEYHVFDSLDLPEAPWMLHRIVERAQESLEAIGKRSPAEATFLHQAAMIADERLYFDYFAGLFARDPLVRLTLDMTPGYAMLGAERLARIREAFDARGIRTVAIFLMRDPVERIWSQIRMQKRRRPQQYVAPAEDLVLEHFTAPGYELRSRYEPTVQALDAAFGDDVQYHFFERLFDPSVLRSICELTGIDFHEPDFGATFNVSPKAVSELPEAGVRRVAEHFRDTYDFVERRFDVPDLGELWPNSLLAR